MEFEQIVMTLNFGNSAFKTREALANALEELAQRYRQGKNPVKIMDANGNCVGHVAEIEPGADNEDREHALRNVNDDINWTAA